VKIINKSDKPFDFTFDSGNYGPYLPGEVVDLPDEIAAHAVKRSEILDPDFGDTIGFQMSYLSDLSQEEIRKHVLYPCPFIQSNQCNAKSFKTPDELRAHLETHWGAPTNGKPAANVGNMQATARPVART
jgi:hypothetical protein